MLGVFYMVHAVFGKFNMFFMMTLVSSLISEPYRMRTTLKT